MAARKSTRTSKPKPSVTRTSATRSQVRNSEVVPRRARSEDEVEPTEVEPSERELVRDVDWPHLPASPHVVKRVGTLPDIGDSDRLPVVEPGVAVEPEDLGTQFLRDATEQDNFESHAPPEEEPAVVILPHVVISDATLDASMQEDAEWFESTATSGRAAEAPREPFQTEVDLTQPTISNASLFDHVVLDEELLDDEAREEVTEEAMTVEPNVHTEDPSETSPFEDAREREILRVRHELSKKRLEAQEAAKRLEGEWAARRREAERAPPPARRQK